MGIIYPAGTQSIRNLKATFSYFLVVKEDSIANDIPQSEYFVYRFLVPVTDKDGINQLNTYFKKENSGKVSICREVSDNEYATGDFSHPTYKNSNRLPLKIKMRDIPIYIQEKIRIIDLNKDLYQYGSNPIFVSKNNYNTVEYSQYYNPILDPIDAIGIGGAKLIE